MHVDRRFLNWGVFFVILGAIPLAVQQRWIDSAEVAGAWRLWPLILVGIGVGVLLRRTPAHFLGGLVVAVTAGVMAGSLLGAGVGGHLDFGCSTGGGPAFAGQSGTISGDDSVNLELSCGDLLVQTAPGASWNLTGRSSDGQVPQVDRSGGGLDIRSHDRGFGPLGPNAERDDWTLTLPADPTLSLSTTVNAGSARFNLANAHLSSVSMTANAADVHLDLSGASVGSVSVTLNAGSTKISLPGASTDGSFTVNAGNLGFCAPTGVGLQITVSDSFIGGNNLADRGLIKDGSTWTTPGYDAASAKINLSASVNVGQIELDPEGGCQ